MHSFNLLHLVKGVYCTASEQPCTFSLSRVERLSLRLISLKGNSVLLAGLNTGFTFKALILIDYYGLVILHFQNISRAYVDALSTADTLFFVNNNSGHGFPPQGNDVTQNFQNRIKRPYPNMHMVSSCVDVYHGLGRAGLLLHSYGNLPQNSENKQTGCIDHH